MTYIRHLRRSIAEFRKIARDPMSFAAIKSNAGEVRTALKSVVLASERGESGQHRLTLNESYSRGLLDVLRALTCGPDISHLRLCYKIVAVVHSAPNPGALTQALNEINLRHLAD